MPRSHSPSRAAAQYAWAGPLRALHRKYRRLASAATRLGAIALGGTVFVTMAGARTGFQVRWVGLVAALIVVGVGGLLLGRAARVEVSRIEDEMARIEEEATRHLPS